MTQNITIIGRGWAGWHAAGPRFTVSGGDLFPCAWLAGGIKHGYLEEAADGALVYDAEQADPEAWAKFVMTGPIVDPSLDPMSIKAFSFEDTIASAQPYHEGTRLGSFDLAGVRVYEAILRKVPGVRIGRVRRGHSSGYASPNEIHLEHSGTSDAVWIEWEEGNDED